MSASECVFCNYFKIYVKPDLDRKDQLRSKNYLMWLDEMYEKHLHHIAINHNNRYRDILDEIQA